MYYGEEYEESEIIKFGLGIPQGLPQSYFLGNICMVQISKIFEEYFSGKSLFYVDDSVIFTKDIQNKEDFEEKLKKEDFKEKLKKINDNISEFVNKYIGLEDNDFFRLYNENFITFLRNRTFLIKVHDTSGKSTFTEIKQAGPGEIHLKSLSREVSQIGFDLYTTYSDEEDENLNAKMEILLNAISQEQKFVKEKIAKVEDTGERESLETYKSKLARYYKFFKYRKLKIDVQRNNKDTLSYGDTIAIPVHKKNFLEEFLDVYKHDIWGAYLGLCIKSNSDEEYLNKIKRYILDVNKIIFGFDNYKSS